MERLKFLSLILRIFNPEGFGQNAVVEFLLLHSLQELLIQHSPLLLMQSLFFLYLRCHFLIVRLPVSNRLSHLQSTFIRHGYQLFSPHHFCLLGSGATPDVLLLLRLKPNQILSLPARVLHFLVHLVFFAFELVDAILQFEDALLLLQPRLPRLAPA